MAGGGAEAETEEEHSSRSSSGSDSEKWETSEEGRTKSKGKLLPDGFLDPLPPQKSLKRPRFSERVGRSSQHRTRGGTVLEVPADKFSGVQLSIASLGASHRAHDPEHASPLVASTHLRMAREWPVHCPRLLYVLKAVGLDSVQHLQFIRLDHNLITVLVERWCPMTNTFHFTIGEMTVTLQDVQVLLGLRVAGPPIVGPLVIGEGLRWQSWPDCCDELLGTHPARDIVYHDPRDVDVQASFRMGVAQVESMVPLRWLRWTFYRESYNDLPPVIFLQHVRAYILFMIGCFLIPDTSRSHVSLQWLPLLSDLDTFAMMSMGSAVLAHLYRELCLATRPTRTYIAGCVALLQVWSWERLYVGRPTLRVPHLVDLDGRPLGCRWDEDRIREIPSGNTMTYRDELDGLRVSQVKMTPYTDSVLASLPERCRVSTELWTARVPMISWKRAEWHLPDRVMRQFGGVQFTSLEPMERGFKRIDGRGRADMDWTVKYRTYIEMWNNIYAYLVPVIPPEGNDNQEFGAYLRWYRSWASIYLLKPQTLPPETFFPRSPVERLVVDYYIRSYDLLKPLSGGHGENASSLQLAIDQVVELADRVQRSVYVDYSTFDTSTDEHSRYRTQTAQGSRRSTSNASSTSTGGYRRESQVRRESMDTPRHSMYVGTRDSHMPSTYVGQSSLPTQQFSAFDAQVGHLLDLNYANQSQHTPSYSSFNVPMPHLMAFVGLSSSPIEQDLLLQQGQHSQEDQHVEGEDIEDVQAPLQRRV